MDTQWLKWNIGTSCFFQRKKKVSWQFHYETTASERRVCLCGILLLDFTFRDKRILVKQKATERVLLQQWWNAFPRWKVGMSTLPWSWKYVKIMFHLFYTNIWKQLSQASKYCFLLHHGGCFSPYLHKGKWYQLFLFYMMEVHILSFHLMYNTHIFQTQHLLWARS